MRTDDETFLRNTYTLRRLVGDKWTPAILFALADGPQRPSEIMATINTFSPMAEEWTERRFKLHDSILARALRKLVEEGLVVRHDDGESFPPRVFYALTGPAQEYLKMERPLADWAGRHVEQIAASRRESA